MKCKSYRRLLQNVPASRSANAGFTLVEVLLVVAILGILAGVVVVSTRGRIPATQVNACRMSIEGLSTAVGVYEIDNGILPNSLDNLVTKSSEMNWNGPYVKSLNDPWGNPFSYSREGNVFKIISGGPDGQAGTGDDITN
jgi:general secretion pathway protein G